ncbi:MAG: ABC transporter permease [Caulobacteraceae bacterium]|nr:ABC transporter permease [Caulobacteraceae bacterium]
MSSESTIPTAPAAAGPIAPSLGNNLSVMGRVIFALMIRESRTRYGKSDLGYLWALFDPAIQLAVFWVVFTLIQRANPLPTTMPVFLLTGIMPYFFWRNCISRGATAAQANLPLLTYPQVKVFDVVIARVLLDAATFVIVTMIFIIGLRFLYNQLFISWVRVPIVLVGAVVALFYFSVCGAIFSANLARLWPVWPQVFGYLSRPLYFTSGIFFTLGSLPTTFRKYASLNPIAHLLEWLRTGAIPGFVSTYYNPWFVIVTATLMLFVGLVINWSLRLVGHTDESG